MTFKEAIRIRKESHRDEGSYQLCHAYDGLPDATADRRIKTRKNRVSASSDEDLVMRLKNEFHTPTCTRFVKSLYSEDILTK